MDSGLGPETSAPRTTAPAVSPLQQLRRRAGDELRAVIDTLLTEQSSEDGLHRALSLLDEARTALAGPSRPAYNADPAYWMGQLPDSWDRYLDETCFGGRVNPLGNPTRLEWGVGDDGMVFADASVRLGRAFLGGPGMVHGGYVAGLVDHMFGVAMHAGPVTAVTATLQIRYVAPTPVGEELHLRAWFDRAEGRRLVGRATVHAGDVLTAEAEGLFVRVDLGEMARRLSAG